MLGEAMPWPKARASTLWISRARRASRRAKSFALAAPVGVWSRKLSRSCSASSWPRSWYLIFRPVDLPQVHGGPVFAADEPAELEEVGEEEVGEGRQVTVFELLGTFGFVEAGADVLGLDVSSEEFAAANVEVGRAAVDAAGFHHGLHVRQHVLKQLLERHVVSAFGSVAGGEVAVQCGKVGAEGGRGHSLLPSLGEVPWNRRGFLPEDREHWQRRRFCGRTARPQEPALRRPQCRPEGRAPTVGGFAAAASWRARLLCWAEQQRTCATGCGPSLAKGGRGGGGCSGGQRTGGIALPPFAPTRETWGECLTWGGPALSHRPRRGDTALRARASPADEVGRGRGWGRPAWHSRRLRGAGR